MQTNTHEPSRLEKLADQSVEVEWPGESRIDAIGQNGNDGEHYPRATWDEAPNAANWFSVDDDGSAFWWEEEPVKDEFGDHMAPYGSYNYAGLRKDIAGHKEARPV